MKTTLFTFILAIAIHHSINGQCQYIAASSGSTSSIALNFSGGSFQSYGCAPIDPTYWITGGGATVLITFENPASNPRFRVWGMNDDDVASVRVNGQEFPLNATSASFEEKVVCGISPGPDGITFSNGNLMGANDNTIGNYSYQDVKLNVLNVSTLEITALSGAGWGFAGILIKCPPSVTAVHEPNQTPFNAFIYPNSFTDYGTLQFNAFIRQGEVTIYNLAGQKLKSLPVNSSDRILIERGNIPAGIYFYELNQTNKIKASGRFMISD